MNNIIVQKWFKIKIQFNHVHFNFSALKFFKNHEKSTKIITWAISKSKIISIQGKYNAMKFLFICNFPRTTLSKNIWLWRHHYVIPNLSRIYRTSKGLSKYSDLVSESKLSRDHRDCHDNLVQNCARDRPKMIDPIDTRQV